MSVIDFPQSQPIDLEYVRSLKPLVSLPVAGSVLGMSRQNATQLARQGRFPVPVLGEGRGARVARRDLEALLLPAQPDGSQPGSCACSDRLERLTDLVKELADALAGPASTAARIRAELTR